MFPPLPSTAAGASGLYLPAMPEAYNTNYMQQIRTTPPPQLRVRRPAKPGGGMCFEAIRF